MTISKDAKLEAINARREGPEHRLFGAKLDLDMAKAAGDEQAEQAAQARVDAEEANLKVLDKAAAAAKS